MNLAIFFGASANKGEVKSTSDISTLGQRVISPVIGTDTSKMFPPAKNAYSSIFHGFSNFDVESSSVSISNSTVYSSV